MFFVDLESGSYPKQIEHNMKLATSSVCEWTVALEDCGSGYCSVMSPGYPGIYPPDLDCHYHIFTDDATSTLQLSFQTDSTKPTEFDLRVT